MIQAERIAAAEWERTRSGDTALTGFFCLVAGPLIFAAGWWLLAQSIWEAITKERT